MSEQQGQELTCADCGREFSFTESEQRFFREKGFNPPKRCPDCRQAKKEQRERGGDR